MESDKTYKFTYIDDFFKRCASQEEIRLVTRCAKSIIERRETENKLSGDDLIDATIHEILRLAAIALSHFPDEIQAHEFYTCENAMASLQLNLSPKQTADCLINCGNQSIILRDQFVDKLGLLSLLCASCPYHNDKEGRKCQESLMVDAGLKMKELINANKCLKEAFIEKGDEKDE